MTFIPRLAAVGFEALEPRRLFTVAPLLGSFVEAPLPTDPAGGGDVVVDDPQPADSVQMNTTPWTLVVPGTSFDSTVANFSGPLSADQYSATIDWGDGTTSAGDIQLQQDGTYAVVGSHDFGVKGNFDIFVEVDATDGSSGFDSHSIYTQAGPLVMTSDPSVWTTTGDSVDDVYVASFFDQNPADASAYAITIDWGDGTTSAGQATDGWDTGSFDITANHAYATAGTYNISVTISKPADTGQAAASITGTGTAEADDPIQYTDPVMILPDPIVTDGNGTVPVIDYFPTLMLDSLAGAGVAMSAPASSVSTAAVNIASSSSSSSSSSAASAPAVLSPRQNVVNTPTFLTQQSTSSSASSTAQPLATSSVASSIFQSERKIKELDSTESDPLV